MNFERKINARGTGTVTPSENRGSIFSDLSKKKKEHYLLVLADIGRDVRTPPAA